MEAMKFVYSVISEWELAEIVPRYDSSSTNEASSDKREHQVAVLKALSVPYTDIEFNVRYTAVFISPPPSFPIWNWRTHYVWTSSINNLNEE